MRCPIQLIFPQLEIAADRMVVVRNRFLPSVRNGGMMRFEMTNLGGRMTRERQMGIAADRINS